MRMAAGALALTLMATCFAADLQFSSVRETDLKELHAIDDRATTSWPSVAFSSDGSLLLAYTIRRHPGLTRRDDSALAVKVVSLSADSGVPLHMVEIPTTLSTSLAQQVVGLPSGDVLLRASNEIYLLGRELAIKQKADLQLRGEIFLDASVAADHSTVALLVGTRGPDEERIAGFEQVLLDSQRLKILARCPVVRFIATDSYLGEDVLETRWPKRKSVLQRGGVCSSQRTTVDSGQFLDYGVFLSARRIVEKFTHSLRLMTDGRPSTIWSVAPDHFVWNIVPSRDGQWFAVAHSKLPEGNSTDTDSVVEEFGVDGSRHTFTVGDSWGRSRLAISDDGSLVAVLRGDRLTILRR